MASKGGAETGLVPCPTRGTGDQECGVAAYDPLAMRALANRAAVVGFIQ